MALYNSNSWLNDYSTVASPYETGIKAGAQLAPIAQAASTILEANKSKEKTLKIKAIIDDETQKAGIRPGMTPVVQDAEGNLVSTGGPAKGELDYKSLERRLLPYDQELSAKYGAMAEKQAAQDESNALKREQFNTAAKVKSDAAIAKQQSLTNKFDLTTYEGKLAWKDTLRKLQGSPLLFSSTVDEGSKNSILAQIADLKGQAAEYPELLRSLGLPIVKSEFDKLSDALLDNDNTNDPTTKLLNELKDSGKLTKDQFKYLIDKLPKHDSFGFTPVSATSDSFGFTPVSATSDSSVVDNTAKDPYSEIVKLIDKEKQVFNNGVLKTSALINIINSYDGKEFKNLSKDDRTNVINQAKGYVESLAKNIKDDYDAKEAHRRESKDDKKTEATVQLELAKDYKPINDLAKKLNNSSPANDKKAIINLILRKQSGSTYTAQEFQDLMSVMLSEYDATALVGDLKQSANYIAKLVDADQQLDATFTNRYLAKVDSQKLKEYVAALTPNQYNDGLSALVKNNQNLRSYNFDDRASYNNGEKLNTISGIKIWDKPTMRFRK